MPTNIYVTGSLLSVSDSLGAGGFVIKAAQRNTQAMFVGDDLVMLPTGTLHVRRLAASSSAQIAIFEGSLPTPKFTPYYAGAQDVFFYVSGTQGLAGSAADIAVFGGDVVISGSTTILGWINDSGNIAITGSLSVNGPLGVTGSFNVQGNTAITGSLSVNGPTNLTGSVNINGSVFVSGSLVGQRNIRVVTGSWIAQTSDDVVITSGLGGSMQLTLPAAPATGQQFTLKDGDGVANTKNHIIGGNGKNIDGGATAVIVNPFTSLTVAYNGTQWSII
jgi:hypothetical protein